MNLKSPALTSGIFLAKKRETIDNRLCFEKNAQVAELVYALA